MSTTDIYHRLTEKFPITVEFPGGFNRRTLNHWLNTLKLNGILDRRVSRKNVAYWILKADPWLPVEDFLAEIDKIRIGRYQRVPEWMYIRDGITVYEFPKFHIEGHNGLEKKFTDILNELIEIRKKFWELNLETVKLWKKKIVSNLFTKKGEMLDTQLALLYCYYSHYSSISLKKWFEKKGHDHFIVKADMDFVDLIKKIFNPPQNRAKLLSKLKNHTISIEASTVMQSYRTIHELYPASVATTIVMRLPELNFDTDVIRAIHDRYKKEEHTLKADFSGEINKLDNIMSSHFKGFLEFKREKKEAKENIDDISNIKSFIKEFAPDLTV